MYPDAANDITSKILQYMENQFLTLTTLALFERERRQCLIHSILSAKICSDWPTD
jgi:hypothetical protein